MRKILPDPARLKGSTVPTSDVVAALAATVDARTATAVLDRMAATDPTLADEFARAARHGGAR